MGIFVHISFVEMNAYLDYRKDDQTPLIAAVKHEQQNMVKYLLSKKADIFTVDGHHNTILHLAAKMGDRGICKLALENGTLPHVLNEEEKTPIELSKTEDVARTILSDQIFFQILRCKIFNVFQFACKNRN